MYLLDIQWQRAQANRARSRRDPTKRIVAANSVPKKGTRFEQTADTEPPSETQQHDTVVPSDPSRQRHRTQSTRSTRTRERATNTRSQRTQPPGRAARGRPTQDRGTTAQRWRTQLAQLHDQLNAAQPNPRPHKSNTTRIAHDAHKTLNHANPKRLRRAIKAGVLPGVTVDALAGIELDCYWS